MIEENNSFILWKKLIKGVIISGFTLDKTETLIVMIISIVFYNSNQLRAVHSFIVKIIAKCATNPRKIIYDHEILILIIKIIVGKITNIPIYKTICNLNFYS